MSGKLSAVLFTLTLSMLVPAPCAPAQDDIVVDYSHVPEESEDGTESESEPLMETEMTYEIPAGITDGLKKDTPTGEAAGMTMGECGALIDEVCLANAGEELWKKHDDVSASFRLFDDDSETWKEYSAFYADPLIYYSDDWTPGLEELRLLIYGENACVEDYMTSMRFVCFLNASGKPYRSRSDAVTLDDDTREEMLLAVHRTSSALLLVTQLTESTILRFGLEELPENEFYSCVYLLDPSTLEVQTILISRHNEDGSVSDVRHISFSYDHGMTPFVETGYMGLVRHMTPGVVWAPEYLRDVRVILDPGTENERTCILTALKGDPVSYTLPDGYVLYADETLTRRWVDNGDYASDLTLWAAPE